MIQFLVALSILHYCRINSSFSSSSSWLHNSESVSEFYPFRISRNRTISACFSEGQVRSIHEKTWLKSSFKLVCLHACTSIKFYLQYVFHFSIYFLSLCVYGVCVCVLKHCIICTVSCCLGNKYFIRKEVQEF